MEKSGGKFYLEWESHSKHVSRGLCLLMERQFLVDITLCCGSNTLHAHKCVLAAGSTYFKEHLENKAIEQIIINGVDFNVMKAIIEFMYCGECAFVEGSLKHFIAAVKYFKIAALEAIFSENEYRSVAVDEITIPPPQFICKPPKYPTIFKPLTSSSLPKINYALNNAYVQYKCKRKCLGSEAEKACAKEAQASRIALANLRKVMANAPQVHSFIVEESFNETTVENFIPNVEETYVENVQFVNGNPPEGGPGADAVPESEDPQGLTADKIKHILGSNEVEIMFQTSDGNFVNVSDEVLLNLSKEGLQYQVVDENGHIGEVQELKTIDNSKNENLEELQQDSNQRKGDLDVNVKGAGDMPGEYIDADFSEEGCGKSNLESLELHTNFNEALYDSGFNMQNSEIFGPENLSMHADLMPDTPVNFDPVNEKLKYKCLARIKRSGSLNTGSHDPLHDSNEMVVLDKEQTLNNASLKFSPDMFFAELPSGSAQNSDVINLVEDEAEK